MRERAQHTKQKGEDGYIIATTALLLVPMMIFAAFATDVGGWYVRGQEIQRASDAAALAAVVWMPDQAAAERAAIEVAALNGFVDQTPAGVDNDPNNMTPLTDFDDPDAPLPQVKVTALGGQRIMVEIRAEGDIYFGAVAGMDEIDITRFASAEYVLPVPMGNPTSAIGTGDIDIGGQQFYWLNAHADCFSATAGDLLNSANMSSSGNSSTPGFFNGNVPSGCAPTGSNPLQNPQGYTYVIDKPAGVAITVQTHHAGRCKRPWWPGNRGESHGSNTPALDFTLYAADNTPLLDSDNLVASNIFASDQIGGGERGNANTNNSTGAECPQYRETLNPAYDPGADSNNTGVDDQYWADDAGELVDANWNSVFTIPASATPGRWFLTVATPPGSTGHKNMYSLRVLGSNFPVGAEVCSTLIPSSVTTGTCPTITALDRFGIYIGENTSRPDLSPAAASFYFAEVQEVHAGKTMEINLWDAAEGSDFLQFINPQGVAVPFRYRVTDVNGNGGAAWTDVAGTCPGRPDANGEPCLVVSGSSPFASRFLILEIELGTGYSCNGTDCWWRVRYGSVAGGAVDDSTTWSVRIVGDPVRLIE